MIIVPPAVVIVKLQLVITSGGMVVNITCQITGLYADVGLYVGDVMTAITDIFHCKA